MFGSGSGTGMMTILVERWHRTRTLGGGAASGTARVFRGGSWGRNASYATVANRLDYGPIVQDGGIGVRVVRP